MEPSWYRPSVTAVRYLLGAQYLVSGLGWWIPVMPFPNAWNWTEFPQKHPVAGEMIATGWMYQLAKVIEVFAGLSLLSNMFVPLMLVVSFAVALNTFLLDAMIGRTVSEWFAGRASFGVLRAKILDAIYFGGAVLAMQGYLMLAYLHVYKPMMARKVDIQMP
ncbi:MAG: hypothetical protein JNJ73_19190 [Hyphomonadaceae bacterium]|nr:hypothetical protein [Hyphomonadaceae bacterium]